MSTAIFLAMEAGPLTRRARYEQIRARLFDVRKAGGFDATWRDVAEFLMPRRTRFFAQDRNRGERRSQSIIDSTGKFALLTSRSGMHAGVTSPARPWFKLSTPDPSLAEFHPVKDWLHVVAQRLYAIFTQSNIYNTLPLVYGDILGFGTGAMAIVEDDRRLFHCFSYPLGSYAIGLNRRGQATTFVRDYELTVRQIVEEFCVQPGSMDLDWSNVSTRVQDFWRRGDYEQPISVTWIVQPNEQLDPRRLDARFSKPWSSVHFESDVMAMDAAKLLRDSGFDTFPIMVPRWDITGEDAYGTDYPGLTALGDVKQLQGMQRKKAQLLAKAVDPPLKGPSFLRTQKTSLAAGDITYVDEREGSHGLSPIHEVRLEGYQHITADIQDVRRLINTAFYADLFLMMQQSDASRGLQPVTAREIDERHEEKLLALGPVMERLNAELLNPIIDRAFDVANRAGLIPDPPDELDGVTLKVEFTSIMAQAQKLIGVAGQDRFLQTMIPLLETGIVNKHKINGNQIIDNYQEMLGTDPRTVRTNEEADAMAADEADQQKGMMAAQQAKDMGAAAQSMGAKPIAPDSALDRLMQGAGQ